MQVGDLVRFIDPPPVAGILLGFGSNIVIDTVMDAHGNCEEVHCEKAAWVLWQDFDIPCWNDATALEVISGTA